VCDWQDGCDAAQVVSHVVAGLHGNDILKVNQGSLQGEGGGDTGRVSVTQHATYSG